MEPEEAIRNDLREVTKKSSRYQARAIVINCLIWVSITYTSMIASFVFMNPLIECGGKPAVEHEACPHLKECIFTNDFTATYAEGLYCEHEEARLLIQSVFPFGCFIGLLFLPLLGEWAGRRPALLTGIILEIVGILILLAGLNHHDNILIALGHFVIGIFAAGCSVVTYVVSSDICTDAGRQGSMMLYNAVWGLAEVSFYWIFNYLPNWYDYLLYFVTIPAFLTLLLVYFFLDETPYFYLIIQKSNEKYDLTMRRIAQVNSLSLA